MNNLHQQAKNSGFSKDYQKVVFEEILRYIIYCYEIVKEAKIYSRNDPQNKGIPFENVLRDDLVDNYLSDENIKLSYGNFFADNLITFEFETEKLYYDVQKQKNRRDKIDIYICVYLTVQGSPTSFMGNKKVEYFAIECKIVSHLSNTHTKYITDIEKFTSNREYKKTRSPFEGMIAFIEQHKGIESIIKNIDQKLKKYPTIQTTQNLKVVDLKNGFPFCRHSKHLKQDETRTEKEIYHLFFNYTQLIAT